MKDWKSNLVDAIANENKSCKIVSLREMALANGIKHIKRADALEIMRKAKALRPGTKLMQIMKTRNDSLFCSICLVDNDIHFDDDEITEEVPEEDKTMKLYTIKPEYAENWTNIPEDAEKPITMEEIERLAREWDVPVSDLMEQVEEYDGDPDADPHWYLIDDKGDTFDSLMKATTQATAARELIREWDALSPHDQKDRKAFYAAYGTKDRQGDILYGDDGYEISLNIPPKSVSLDNGNSYDSDAEYLMGLIEEGNLWDSLVEFMDDDTRELVASMDPVNDKQFLEWYLLLAPTDLIVG